METKTKYRAKLQPLMERASFTAADAKALGIPLRILAYLVQKGDLERLGRGVYRSTSYDWTEDATLEELIIAASTIPNGVICLISALRYYEMTEEIIREHWIAIPHSQWAPSPLPRVRIVRMRNIQLGRKMAQIGGCKVAIFDRERCVVDAFRYLSKEIAIKALKAYLHDGPGRPDLQKLTAYAKTLRVNLDPHILPLLST